MMAVLSLPWSQLPPDLGAIMRPHLDEVTAAVIGALPAEVPKYARPLEGRFGEGVRRGVGVALGRFLDLPGTTKPALATAERKVYVSLGRGEMRQGRQLETLLAAYRVGARVAFRQFAQLARAGDIAADDLVTLAEAVFAYIDELSAASVEGYTLEQSLQAGEAGRRRTQLVEQLVTGQLEDTEANEAASRSGWVLPDELVVVVMPITMGEGLAFTLGSEWLVAERGDHVLALVAAPTGRAATRRLNERLSGRRAVVGSPRPWQHAAFSLRLALLGEPVRTESAEPMYVDEHLTRLLIRAVPELADDLIARRLAPLASLRPDASERLAATLLSWLRHRGERQHVAAELHIHTQTVGYRLGKLRELFGAALDDPDARFELELALRARPRSAGPTAAG